MGFRSRVSVLILAVLLSITTVSCKDKPEDITIEQTANPIEDARPTQEGSQTRVPFDKWTPNRETDEIITLTWLTAITPNNATEEKNRYFNELLLEKGLPFQVEFIHTGTVYTYDPLVDYLEAGAVPDIICCGYHISGDAAYFAGLLTPLDDLLGGDAGAALFSSLPDTIWDYGIIDGSRYYIYSPNSVYYTGDNQPWILIYDKELAEKYGLDISTWTDGWANHTGEIRTVCLGEANNPSFLPFGGVMLTNDDFSSVIYTYYDADTEKYVPYILSDDGRTVSSIASLSRMDWLPFFEKWSGVNVDGNSELPRWASCYAELFELEQVNLYNGREAYEFAELKYFLLTQEDSAQIFLQAYNNGSWEALQSRYDDDFWETHGYVVCDSIVDRSCLGLRTAISAASTQQEAAVALLAAIYTDPELSGALCWGYDRSDAEQCAKYGNYMQTGIGGNMLITGQNSDLYDDLWASFAAMLEESAPSPLMSAAFDTREFHTMDAGEIAAALNDDLSDYLEDAK